MFILFWYQNILFYSLLLLYSRHFQISWGVSDLKWTDPRTERKWTEPNKTWTEQELNWTRTELNKNWTELNWTRTKLSKSIKKVKNSSKIKVNYLKIFLISKYFTPFALKSIHPEDFAFVSLAEQNFLLVSLSSLGSHHLWFLIEFYELEIKKLL